MQTDNNNPTPHDPASLSDLFNREKEAAWQECRSELHIPSAGYSAELGRKISDIAFFMGYQHGYFTAFNSESVTRLEVASTAMQGLLAGGYMPEHNDIPAEAIRLADRLISQLSKPSDK